MLKSWTILLFICLPPLYLTAQKQGNIWYFGSNAGIDFNANPPVALTNGAMSTDEGCASICDTTGRILFYTDGQTVYNKNHQVMVNGQGLAGHNSATQAAAIIPWPEKDSLYYIFTADAYENGSANGYTYSLININRNNGLGDVITKNQLLYSPSTEKLTVAQHANGMDWWVITRQWGNDQFNVYLVDKNGIHNTPVISNIGDVLNHPSKIAGCMKVAPNNKRLAVAYFDISDLDGYIEILDFDNATGKITNPIKVREHYPYGLEFSPNSTYLYISSIENSIPKIDQLDISMATTVAGVEATRTLITPPAYTLFSRGLQLGPDNKIYINNFSQIAVIDSPENKGAACNFQDNVIDLKGKFGGLMFPSIIFKSAASSPPFQIDFTMQITNTCKREVQLSASSNQITNITYNWQLGNGQSGSTSSLGTTYPFTKNEFDITLDVTADIPSGTGTQRQTRSITKKVTFPAPPKANAGNDTIAKAGMVIQLKAMGGGSYQWSPANLLDNPSIADPKASLQKDQMFILTVTDNNGCTDKDSLTIKVYKAFDIYVPTSFTPNADGKNDVLHVLPVGIKLSHFSVFNRWGNLVFSTKDPFTGWDGHYKSKLQPADTYVWVAKGTDETGKLISRKGSFYLMR